MKLRNKRIISLLLALVMLCGMMPVTAFAAEETEANPWSGRSAVFVGDSITAGSGTTQIYYQYLEESLVLGSVAAMGVGGSCISAASDYGTGNQPLINRYQNIPSTDLIVIFMGTNDYGHETPLGSIEDTKDGSFYGALNTIIPALVAKHTASKIVFVTPLHRYGFGTSKILGTNFTYDSIPNGVGATLGDYVDALKTVCANNGVSVIDLHTECTLDPSDAAVRSTYMPDGLHPNASGHEVIAGILESHIRTLEPAEAPETDPTEPTEPAAQTELVYGNRFASGFSQQNRASSRVNYYLKAGTVITLKDPSTFQWACARSTDENSSSNLGYFPEGGWSNKDTAVVAEDGWIGFTFKYRDETQSFDLTKPLSDYITIEEPHTHTYENGTCTGCGATVSPYLQQLPENVIGCTNLYDSLVPVKGYYTATKYDTSNGAVLSVVIPVEPGDRIAASSFGPVSENMGSVNGIRVTYLLGDKIVTSLSPGDVYSGYTSNGYITVPDGVDAVCIPWWKPSDSNWLTLSQISKDFAVHVPKPVSAQAPTCTETGYTAGEICEICNASLGEREEIPPIGHSYSGDTCSVCGAVNLLAFLDGKYVSVLGDSISTFNGYSNDATVNTTIAGNGPRYDVGAADTKPGSYCLLESVDDTWWMHFAGRSGMKLLVNNSWAGSQVFGGKTSDGRVIPAAYLDRCVNLHDNTLENNPGNTPINPDVIFVYLGINDYNFNRAKVGTGTVDYAGLVNPDGTCVTPATFGEAYGIMLHKMRNAYPDAQIFAMTLLPENLYSVDKTAWEQHNAYIRAAAEYYHIPVVDLAKNCAITWENYSGYMIDKIHPTTAGMELISDCMEAELAAYYQENPPHTHSYESAVTAPTCTGQGYTTYTCACGERYVDDYVDALGHTYENGICTGCRETAEGAIWTTANNGQVTGAFASLQEAVNFCADGDSIVLTDNCIVNSGAAIDKDITIDGGNHLVDISGCGNAFITVAEGAEVVIRDLQLDGGASGFEVDYDAVTYTNYTIPLVSGSLDNDPKASQSAMISSGNLVCENVDITNRYTASVGGAMRILAGSVRLTDCDFVHNYGTSKGGALYIGSNFGTRTEYPVEQVTITGCTFTENYTGHGGAIYAYNVEEIEITDSEFLNNTANGGKGGAIDLFSQTTTPTTAMNLGLDFIQTTVRGCTFRGNWAGNDGFAIQSYDSDLYIYNSEFIENVGVHPTSSVGTVSIEAYRHADESYRIYTLLDGCLFESNEGPCAVYGDHSSIADLDVTGCVFRNNRGNDSFLLYSATSHITNCQFIGETTKAGVIDARIYQNYTIPPLLILTDITFTDCDTPAEILTRKQNHNLELNTYQVILEGTTNGDITIWDSNAVTINGTHTGNIQFGYDSEPTCLTVGSNGTVNGIIFTQPIDAEAKLGERYMVEVLAEGEGLTYRWYGRNPGSKGWFKSSVKDNTYDDVMTAARAGREVYCVITDANGNSVTTDIVKLVLLPSEELAIVTQPTDGEAALGERYCVTVEARGEGLRYQWYFRNKGATRWTKSSVTDNTYDDIMNNTRNGREVKCVITDKFGNSVTTDIVKLVRIPMKLEITSQPTDATAAFGEMFCATVVAKGEGLKYQWYYRNSSKDSWHKSGVRDNTYDDVMTKARNGREVYCVITDKYGNSVTTAIVKLMAVPGVELKLLSQSYESAAMGARFCVTVNAQGDGLTYQWYFRNAGSSKWYKSGVRDNTYDDVMNKTRANRQVYCVITDAFGNTVTTETVTLVCTDIPQAIVMD